MKKFILGLLVLTSISSQAATKFSGKQGETYSGNDSVTGKACTVSIKLIGKDKSGRLSVAINVRRDNFSIDSIVNDLDLPSDLRGGMRSNAGENLYSNLFLNEETGSPKDYDLSDFNTGKAVISCGGLEKL